MRTFVHYTEITSDTMHGKKKSNANNNMHLKGNLSTSHHALKLYKNLFFFSFSKLKHSLNDQPGVSIKYMQNTFAGAKCLRYDATITDKS